MSTCPNCGHCPHCGRSNWPRPPLYPNYGPIWVVPTPNTVPWNMPTITCDAGVAS